MYKLISQLLTKEGISCFAPISLRHCWIKKKYLLDKEKITDGTAIIMAVPYFTPACIGSSVSAYTVSRDYHLFFSELFAKILPILKEKFPNSRFAGFTDHSPIAEIEAAAAAGLGVIGKNNLLITEKYSSCIFLGEIVTDLELPSDPSEIKLCESCGLCSDACPVDLSVEACLSALTQKKGELTEKEKAKILDHGLVWGCDRCQTACPHTQRAIRNETIYSIVDFFSEKCLPELSAELVEKMPDEDFEARAYSWRGKETVLRNLRLFESEKHLEDGSNK